METRALGVVKEILEGVGFNVAGAYDDLVFVECNAFLLQFDDRKENRLKLMFNTDCKEEMKEICRTQLKMSAETFDFELEFCGDYSMTEGDNGMRIEFHAQ